MDMDDYDIEEELAPPIQYDYIDGRLMPIYQFIEGFLREFSPAYPPMHLDKIDRYTIRRIFSKIGYDATDLVVKAVYGGMGVADLSSRFCQPRYALRHWRSWYDGLIKDDRMSTIMCMLAAAKIRWDLDDNDHDLLKWYWRQAEKGPDDALQPFEEWLAEEVGSESV